MIEMLKNLNYSFAKCVPALQKEAQREKRVHQSFPFVVKHCNKHQQNGNFFGGFNYLCLENCIMCCL